MELRQIRSFLSVAKTLHFGRTVELIHLSQPALSLQIRTLEEELGVRLFERNRRKTTLTAAGLAFRDDAACSAIAIGASDSQGEACCQWETWVIADRLRLNCGK
jgi:hypothetical protein